MTPEQINAAIAESLGWTEIHFGVSDEGNAAWIGSPPRPLDAWGSLGFVPNFHGCLNACHEMEKAISAITNFGYAQELRKITLRDSEDGSDLCTRLIHATAPQRCEAYLKTKGIWR